MTAKQIARSFWLANALAFPTLPPTPASPRRRKPARVRLDGAEEPERVTPEDQPGTHFYDFSPDLRWAFHTYSTFDTPR